MSTTGIELINEVLDALLNTTNDFICVLEAETFSLLAFNAATARHFATKFGKALRVGTRLEDVLDEKGALQWRQLFQRAVREGPFSVEHRGLVKGQTLWLSFNRLVKDGQCFGISSFARDITQFEQAVRAAESAKDRFANVFRHTPSPLAVTTIVEGRIIDANHAFAKLIGFERLDLIGRTSEELGIWANASERARIVEFVQTKGRLVDFTAKYRHRDGRLLHGMLACEAINLDGVACFLLSIVDITPLRNIEQALRESELRYRAMIETAPDSIVLIDTDTGRYTDANENASRLSGYDRSVLVGMGPVDLSPIMQPDGRASADVIKASLERAAQGEHLTFEWLRIRRDGTEVPCEVRLAPFPDSNRRMVRGSIIDISERKRMEREAAQLRAQLEQAQRLEALGTLAGGIAHDFNNILSAIVGYAEHARLQEQDSEVRSFIENIERGVDRARDLVRQILTFSRRGTQHKKPVQVVAIVTEAIKLLRAALPTTITVHQRYDSSGSVMVDPIQIHQVVMNLGTNAGLAMREKGGVLGVCVTEKDIDGQSAGQHPGLQPGRHLSVTISDTGCGIAPENLGRIFEPFFTTRPQGEGTGLGLSVTYGIVKDAGGVIMVTSALGRGTTFEVLLPLCAPAVSEDTPPVVCLATGKQRVLFVDDDPALANVMNVALGHFSYDVTAFTDPVEAIAAFGLRPSGFDILVTDATMPRLTGHLLAAAIKKVRPDLPMILVSGAADRVVQDEAQDSPFAAFLDKPYRPSALAQIIQDVCGKRALTKRHS